MTIGSRIKARRKELGLSVDEVAEKLKKNRATVYRYESDDIENLPTTILEPLAIILQTTPAYLMGWDLKEEKVPSTPTNSLPTLTSKDERDIARDLQKILLNLESDAGLAFYEGEPMSEESKEVLRISLENSMRLAKQLAKKKYTPKKYRK